MTNADWEQGIYKDRLEPNPDLPIVDDEASSDDEALSTGAAGVKV